MNTKNIIIILVITLIVVGGGVALITGLSSEKPESKKTLNDNDEPLISTEPTDDLASVLARVQDISSVKYDIKIISPEAETEMSFALKGNKIRGEMTQEGQESVMLINTNTQTFYSYMPAENMAFSLDRSLAQEIINNSLKEQAHELLAFNPVIVGRETIDNKNCLVVEFFIDEYKNTMWIWEQYGLPIKVESESEQGVVKVSAYNIEFTDLPDNMFELPPGVQVMDVFGQ